MASQPGTKLEKKYGLLVFVLVVALLDLLLKNSFIQLQSQQQQQADRGNWEVARLVKTPVDSVSTKIDVPRTDSITSYVSNQRNLWDNSAKLPPWMKEYFTWHQETLQSLDENNWNSHHYFLYRCVPVDKKCSGTSDRLKAVPALLLLAYRAQPRRLLFFHWSRPARLEEFLIPPAGGMNWTIPHWLADKLNIEQQGPKYFFESKRDFDKFPQYKDPIARVKNVRGSEFYDRSRTKTELSFDQVYHEVWNILFRPSSEIAALVKKEQQEMELQPGQYVAAHIRALYLSDAVDQHEEINAIHCARSTRPGWPIFVASDSVNTTRAAVAYGAKQNIQVVARQSQANPLHLDRGRDFLAMSEDWKGRPASDFYDVFVDLYLLVQSRCVAHGIGGFGSWASLVAGTQDCAVDHRRKNCSAVA